MIDVAELVDSFDIFDNAYARTSSVYSEIAVEDSDDVD